MTLMVVAGAGASHDSVDLATTRLGAITASGRPPLARELFADPSGVGGRLLETYADAIVVVAEIRAAAERRDFESVLAEYAGRRAHARAARQLLATRYYLRNVIAAGEKRWLRECHGVTNWCLFLDILERSYADDVVLVTLNYDTLIEHALTTVFGWSVSDLSSYTQGQYALLKLHGSVDWCRVVDLAREPDLASEDRIIASADRILPAVTRQIAHASESDTTDRVVIPAIGIPFSPDDATECPADHETFLRDRLASVERVIAIGWSGASAWLLKTLADRDCGLRDNVPFDIVCEDEDATLRTARNLHDAGLHAELRQFPEGFSGLVRRAAETGAVPDHDDFGRYQVPFI